MLLLGGSSFPTNRDELAKALTEGLSGVFHLPKAGPALELGGVFPHFDRLHIGLTGAVVRADYRPAPPAEFRKPGVTVADLRLEARPLRYGQAPFNLELSARQVRFDFVHDTRGRGLLVPAEAHDGRVLIQVDSAALHGLALEILQAATAKHGVRIEQANVSLSGEGPRSVGLVLLVRASKKVLLASATVTLRVGGRLTVDDALNATISDLTCDGEGMLGMVAASMLRDELERWEGRSFPLTAFALGNLRLRDLRLRCDEGLQIEAAFGG